MSLVETYLVSSNAVTGIIVVGLICLLTRFLQNRATSKKYRLPPGPPGLPFFGSILTMLFSKFKQHELLALWSKKYGKDGVYAFYMFNTRVVILTKLSAVHEAFKNPDVNDRLPFLPADHAVGRTGNGVAFSNNETWKEQRKFFYSVFRKVDMGVIKFEDLIGAQAERLMSEMAKHNGQRFDPAYMINIAIANIITRIITGVTYDYDDDDFQRVVANSQQLFDLTGPAGLFGLIEAIRSLPIPINMKLREITKELVAFITKSLEEKKKTFNPDDPPTDFISCYLKEMASRPEKSRGSFDEINLTITAFDALVGGWETVNTTLRWALYIFAKFPWAQERVREEIERVVGQGRLPTIADRPNMPYTEASISECMRYIPPTISHLPHTVARDCKIAGYDVPKGSAVTTNLWFLATDPDVWENPGEFRPERFLTESGAFDRKTEPVPFSYGKRVCPGEQLARTEMFIFVTYILQRFALKLPEDVSRSLDGTAGITFRPHAYEIQAVSLD